MSGGTEGLVSYICFRCEIESLLIVPFVDRFDSGCGRGICALPSNVSGIGLTKRGDAEEARGDSVFFFGEIFASQESFRRRTRPC